MDSIEGFILVGGESRRMGTDKARLTLHGQTFVERLAVQLSAVARSISVVGDPAIGAQNNLQTVADVYPRWGALGGVHAALAACAAEWALIVACDFPFTTSQLFNRMAHLREDFEAVAPIQEDQIPQPLCALYRIAACLPLTEEMIKSGERKPVALLQSVRTRWVPFAEIQDLPEAERFFDNINTPEDYARIIEKGTVTRMI
ncbi:MAG: molybdenum cofactor guanylyltransferase [Blastocatellia bacterium]|nr:molybdenum cofactor guanylyltransferase [Blastocatellia bacterium]